MGRRSTRPQRRQRTLDAIKRLLLRESQVQPLLLVFEDLHWIDSETQAPAGQPGREPADGPGPAPRQLPPRVPARLGQQDVLHAAPARPACRPRARRRCSHALLGDDADPASAQAAPDRADRGEPVLPRGERPHAGRDRGPGRRARGLPPGDGSAEHPGARRRCRRSWRPASTACPPTRSGCSRPPPSSGRTCRSPCSRRWPTCRRRAFDAASRTSRPPSSSTRPGSSRTSSTRSSTRSPTRWRTGGCSTTGGAPSTPASSRPSSGSRPSALAEQAERLAHHALRGELWDKAVAYLRQAGLRAMARARQPRGHRPPGAGARGPPPPPRDPGDDRAHHRPPHRPPERARPARRVGAHRGPPPRGGGARQDARRPAPARADRHLHGDPVPGDWRLRRVRQIRRRRP